MNVVLFGATGAVGGGVLRACLNATCVNSVVVVGRRAATITHSKIKSVTHSDFKDFTPIASSFDNINACFFCLGISSLQAKGVEYRNITVDFPMAAQRTLLQRSPNASFHYVTGRGTNASGSLEWQRVKGEAENSLRATSAAVNCYRPAMVDSPADHHGFFLKRIVLPLARTLVKRSRTMYLPYVYQKMKL
eukprot:TRINITY_DN4630_c0_g1_i2.p1 TRINITY_DN4630_c0_g1~~TRINITY_DN4630_c0_g1_i2.p1  ORF type:complete len:191 (+),score=21.89 TRINITY_DN4630_c0_g1_i2:25-597(+)